MTKGKRGKEAVQVGQKNKVGDKQKRKEKEKEIKKKEKSKEESERN